MSENNYKKNIIMKKPWIQPLLEYFKTIKKYNDKLEAIKEKLCLTDNFDPNQIFDFLDFQKNGFLTSKNIIYFLNQTNTKYEEQYTRVLVHNYDKDGDFTLNKKEFLNMILPYKKELKEKILSSINEIITSYDLNHDIKNIFNEIIKEELKLAEDSFYAVKNIYGSPKFTTYESFTDIVKNESYITRKNLNLFLRENGIEYTEDDIYMLMFRIDNDDDNMISYVEFQDIFYPLKNLEKYNDNQNITNFDINDNNHNDLDIELLKYQNSINNTLYSKKYNYDYYSRYKSYNLINDNNFSEYLIKNNYLKNNYNIRNNHNFQDNKNSTFNVSDYQKLLIDMNENLKNWENNKINDNKAHNINENNLNIYNDDNINSSSIKNNNINNDGNIEKENIVNNFDNKYNDISLKNNKDNKNEDLIKKENKNTKDISEINNDDIINKENINNNKIIENDFSLKNNDNDNVKDNKHKDNQNINDNSEKGLNKNPNDLINNNSISDNNIDKKEEKMESLAEENVIKDTNSQNFTNSISEKKEEIKENTNYCNLLFQNCFKFSIFGTNNRNKDYSKKPNKYLIKNMDRARKNDYNYISLTERILNKSQKIYQYENIIEDRNKKDINSTFIDDKYKKFRDNFIGNNESNINNSYKNFINNDEIIEKNKETKKISENINEDINKYITPKTNRNLPSFYYIRNYPPISQTSIISNNNKNIANTYEPKPKTNRLIIKNNSLFDLLNDYIIQDSETEKLLEKLSDCPDFNLINLFQSFLQNDYLNRKIVTRDDIYKTLTNMGLYININDIAYIYLKFNKKFVKDNDNGFTYSEFCHMMTPKKYSKAKNLNKKESKKYFIEFNFKTKRIICSLFKQFIDAEKSNEYFRNELIGNETNMYKIYYCVENLFNSLKKRNKQGIDKDDIFNFMNINGKKLCQMEVEFLMDKFDKNKDGLIDINEFFNEIRPKL